MRIEFSEAERACDRLESRISTIKRILSANNVGITATEIGIRTVKIKINVEAALMELAIINEGTSINV